MPDDPHIFPILLTGFYRFSERNNGKITGFHTWMVNEMHIFCEKTKLLEKQKSSQKFEFCEEMAEAVGFEPT